VLKLAFAGAALGSGIIATIASGDIVTGATTALTTVFGMAAGGVAGAASVYGIESIIGKREETLERMAKAAVLCAFIGAAYGGFSGYNKVMEDKEDQKPRPVITSSYMENLNA
jgi:hypothetical protein